MDVLLYLYFNISFTLRFIFMRWKRSSLLNSFFSLQDNHQVVKLESVQVIFSSQFRSWVLFLFLFLFSIPYPNDIMNSVANLSSSNSFEPLPGSPGQIRHPGHSVGWVLSG